MEDWKRVTHLQRRGVVCLVQGRQGGGRGVVPVLSRGGGGGGRPQGRQGGGRGAVLLSYAGEAAAELCAYVEVLEEECGLQGVRVECSLGWGLGLRPVRGLTGPKKARWAVSKPKYMYGYSYRHV
jgi:hypothetical protein